MASPLLSLCGFVSLSCTRVVERSRVVRLHTEHAGSRSKYIASTRCSSESSSSATTVVHRRSANYQPSLWDDSYIQSLPIDYSLQEEDVFSQIGKMKEDLRHLLINQQDSVQQLQLVDNLQQLGVSYHFQNEIEDILTIIYRNYEDILSNEVKDDLYATSLLFRRLREHGFHISLDIFNRFKDEKRSFNSNLSKDVKGMLSLYEASFLALEGENQMDEARNFAITNLKYLSESLADPSLKKHLAYALELPLHLRIQRLHTRWFVDMYEKNVDMNSTLLRFAKLDFNLVQETYKRELKEVSRWWKNLNIQEDVNFARDRLVESYFWAVGSTFEPEFSRSRGAITKAICLVTTIDDIYDVYGSLEELELFTDAVDRWDENALEQLPDYMKICFMALFNTTKDLASETSKLKGVDTLHHMGRAWSDLCKAYLVEARWYHEGYIPSFTEYLENARISISEIVELTIAYCTSEDLTKESLEQFNFYPEAVYHSSTIFRLCDDLGTSPAELQRGDVQKSIQCYMHETNVSETVAREHIKEMAVSGWKQLNGDCIPNSTFVKSFKKVVLNLPRMAHCTYQYGDGYGEPGEITKDKVTAVLVKPIQL